MHKSVFSWEVGLELIIGSTKPEAAGRRVGRNSCRRIWESGRGRSRFEVCLTMAAVNQPSRFPAVSGLERTDDDEDHDQRRGDAGDLVDHAHRAARQRTLAPREFFAI